MFYPILKENFDDKSGVGLGILKDVLECKVTEARNDAFYLEMRYQNKGDVVKEIKVGRVIKAFACVELGYQHFRIFDVQKDIKGNIVISAEHIYFDLTKIQVWQHKRKSVNIHEVLQGILFNQCVYKGHKFTASSNIGESVSVSFGFQSVTDCLLGTEGSIMDSVSSNYELIRDNNHIKLHVSRGKVRESVIQYRQNIDGFKCIENKDFAYTHIFPYAYSGEANADGVRPFIITDNRIIKIRDHEGEAVNIFMRDFTDDPYWQNYAMDKINLEIFASRHAKKMATASPFKYEINLSKVKLKIDEDLKNISIGDQFKLINDMYNITAMVKVIELTVDSLTGTPISVVLEQV